MLVVADRVPCSDGELTTATPGSESPSFERTAPVMIPFCRPCARAFPAMPATSRATSDRSRQPLVSSSLFRPFSDAVPCYRTFTSARRSAEGVPAASRVPRGWYQRAVICG